MLQLIRGGGEGSNNALGLSDALLPLGGIELQSIGFVSVSDYGYQVVSEVFQRHCRPILNNFRRGHFCLRMPCFPVALKSYL